MKSKASCRQLYYHLMLLGNKDQTGMAGIAVNRPIVIIPIGNYSITYIIYFDFYRISYTIRIIIK